ncbi:MAG: hypothetical protein A4E57_04908 [Syntrophorhabdaceae bacterium PtaU1.Bin034]|nr:MAG: hypothetical protein A4E57_04908 [Syntrophorhabdaceae bacterium PtaU1.Bin034]
MAAPYCGPRDKGAELRRRQDVHKGSHPRHKLRDVHELREPFDYLVPASRVHLETGSRDTEHIGPGVKVIYSILSHFLFHEELLDAVELAQGIGDSRP